MGKIIEVSDLLAAIDGLRSSEPMWSMTKSVQKWIMGVRGEMLRLRKGTDDMIFAEFVTRLLSVASNEKVWWAKTRDNLLTMAPIERKLVMVDDLMLPYLKSDGYRFPAKGASVISQALSVFKYRLNGNWQDYFIGADLCARDGFLDCPFLKIKGVGRKTRDLALTDFTLQYPVIDVHVKRVMGRTGLAGSVAVNLKKDSPSKKEYDGLRDRCFELAKENGLMPAELDRLLWHFGRLICKKTPLCSNCSLQSKCLGSLSTGRRI